MSGSIHPLRGRLVLSTIFMATIALTSAGTGRPASAPLRLWWDGAPLSNALFQLALHQTPSDKATISRSLPIRAFQGLKPDQFGGPVPAAIAFRYNVEAGELSCAGSATLGRGAGWCEFRPSITYALALRRLGVGPHDQMDQLRLGMAQVTVEYARAILNSGLQGGNAEDLKRLRNHGIEPADVYAAADKTADAIIHTQKKHHSLAGKVGKPGQN